MAPSNKLVWFRARRVKRVLVVILALALGLTAWRVYQTYFEPDHWSDEASGVLTSLSLDKLAARPADPSNAVERLPEAVLLGKRLFNDVRLSQNGQIACATCHVESKQFQDGLPLAKALGTSSRRTMPIAGAAHSPWLMWDGRKDSLWSQALEPLENAVEHGGNRARYARLIAANYQTEYQSIFGALPEIKDAPEDAGPLGTQTERLTWQRMSPSQRHNVNRIFANIGKAIAAYEQTLRPSESRFDRYVRATVAGDSMGQRVLSAQEVNGLRLFIGRGQCATCHNGPLFTDHSFHNTGMPQRNALQPDRGRAAAVATVQADEFNCLGSFSDAKPEQCAELRFMVTNDPALEGAFKTPSLRNVAMRAPYMHAGQFANLDDVVAHYVKAPMAVVGHSELAHSPNASGHIERTPILLSTNEQADVARFLGALSDEPVRR